MPVSLPKSTIIKACIDGADRANKAYIAWTGGWSARNAPESLCQIEIARELHRIKCPVVSLEDMVSSLIWAAEGEQRGKKPRNAKGRVDITVWHQSSKPRIAIEVKKVDGAGDVRKDVLRLRQLVNRCQTLQAGLLVVVTHAKDVDTVNHRFKVIAGEHGVILKKKSQISQAKNRREDIVYFGAAVYMVR